MAFPKLNGFDAETFTRRLHEEVRKDDGSAFAVFDPASPTSLEDWTRSVARVRDAAAGTAVFAQDIKNDLDAHKTADFARHQSLSARVAALEEAQQHVPFPGSS